MHEVGFAAGFNLLTIDFEAKKAMLRF